MNRFLLITIFLSSLLYGVEIPTEHTAMRTFGQSVALNSKVIQLSNAQQSVMSLVSGHIEAYYVEPGSKVQKGQKIARIDSMALSQMTAEYLSLKEQFASLEENYQATKRLHAKGMASMQDLNLQSMQRNAMASKITGLKSQLQTLGVAPDNLTKASASYILYAHSPGTVSELLQPLHSVIGEDTPIISVVKDQAFFIKSYLPLEYADKVKIGQKLVVTYNNNDLTTHLSQILPAIDEKTQRIVLLSAVNEKRGDLFMNAYVASRLYFDTSEKYVTVKKSALSFFNNEWVVFVPLKEANGGHDSIGMHRENLLGLEVHEDGHDEHEQAPYEIRVVKVVAEDDAYVGIEGLEVDEAYVSDKSYYVKSLLLKSSLGEHGH